MVMDLGVNKTTIYYIMGMKLSKKKKGLKLSLKQSFVIPIG